MSELKKENLYPLSGNLECGLFGLQEDYEEKSISLDEHHQLRSPSVFLFRASGNSMNPLIVENDIIIVDRSLELIRNTICAFYVDGQRVCKRFISNPQGRWLISENIQYKPINVNEAQDILYIGRVTGISRELL